MDELKPCPFCGSNDIMVMRDNEVIVERYIATCDHCFAQIYRGTLKEVIEAWNTRAE